MTRGRKACTSGDRCEPRTLAESLYCCVHHSGIEPRIIAERIGVRVGYLLDAANPDRDDMQFQSRHLVPLSIVTGNLLPLRFLATALGCLVVPVLQGEASDDSIYEAYTKAVSKIGDDGDLIRRVLSDGDLTQDEAAQVCASVNHTMEVMAAIKQAVLARVAKGQPR